MTRYMTTHVPTTPQQNELDLAPSAKSSRWNIYRSWAACEVGGLTMIEMTEALQADAAEQENIAEMLGPVLDATVESSIRSDMPSALPRFESSKACPLSPSAYLARMLRYTAISPCNLVVGISYLQRLKNKTYGHGTVKLNTNNIQRFLLCANMLASKYLDDRYMSNKQWARVGDLDLQELNSLELDMLKALDFDLHISREDYNEACAMLKMMSLSIRPAKASAIQGALSTLVANPVGTDSNDSKLLPQARPPLQHMQGKGAAQSGP